MSYIIYHHLRKHRNYGNELDNGELDLHKMRERLRNKFISMESNEKKKENERALIAKTSYPTTYKKYVIVVVI